MKRQFPLATALFLTLVFVACDRGSGAVPSAGLTAPLPSNSAPAKLPRTAARAPRIPPRPKVYFRGREGRAEVHRAIADLKEVGLWRPLTEHLYRIEVLVRAGAGAVPEDGHLADARFTKTLIGSGTFDYPLGSYCIIRFYPTAMLSDLARWNSYYERGLTGLVPPSHRQFWASIVGHELSHCPQRGITPTPEPVALAWERRVREALVSAGIE